MSYDDTGRGPLGLRGAHREVADLIRRSERLAVSGEHESLHDAAQQVVKTLVRHIDQERAAFKDIEVAQYGRLVAGQQALIDSAVRFASRPVADAGADLLALLVRQADLEEAAAHGEEGSTAPLRTPNDPFEFSTEWAIGTPLVGSR